MNVFNLTENWEKQMSLRKIRTDQWTTVLGPNLLRLMLLVFLLVPALSGTLLADSGGERGAIPFQEISTEDARLIRSVLDHSSLSRNLDKLEYPGTEQMYSFLLDHLSFASEGIRALGIRDFRLGDNGDGTFNADDQDGVTAQLRRVYNGPGKQIYYAEGGYRGRFIRLTGKAVVTLEYEEIPGNKMRNWIGLDIKLDNSILGSTVKLVSSLVSPMVDQKISSFLDAFQEFSTRLSKDPGAVYERLKESEEFSPNDLGEFKTAFLE